MRNLSRRRRPVVLAATLLAAIVPIGAVAASPQSHDGVTLPNGRRYVVPSGTTRLLPTPLIVMLPGWRQDDQVAAAYTGLDDHAHVLQLTVGYGVGVDRSFNAGACCGTARGRRIDDVGYLAQVIEDAVARYRIDPARVYVVGFSNGGMMAWRLACERPDLVAAVGVVGGSLVAPCRPSRPIAVLHVHGLRDRTVPFHGGWSSYTGNRYPAMPDVRRAVLANAPGSVVELVTLPRVGHWWPTGERDGFDATSELLDFLLAHRRG